jgi:hypothetical protein
MFGWRYGLDKTQYPWNSCQLFGLLASLAPLGAVSSTLNIQHEMQVDTLKFFHIIPNLITISPRWCAVFFTAQNIGQAEYGCV